MSQNVPDETLIRAYLLGQLPEHEQDGVEVRMLTDSQLLRIALMIEGELLDDYVMDLLSDSDRMGVESRLLINASQRRKLQVIKLLKLKSNASSAKRGSTLLFPRLTGIQPDLPLAA